MEIWKDKYLKEFEGNLNNLVIASVLIHQEENRRLSATQKQALKTKTAKVKIKGGKLEATTNVDYVKKYDIVNYLINSCNKIAQTDYEASHGSVSKIKWNSCKIVYLMPKYW